MEMVKKQACIDCGSLNVNVRKQIVDRVSDFAMPHPLKAALGFIMLGVGHIAVSWAMNVGSWLLYPFVVLDVIFVFFGWQICWLELWGHPVAQQTHQCADCGHAWRIREDEPVPADLGVLPVRKPRRVRAF